jgi:ribosomal protein S27AE
VSTTTCLHCYATTSNGLALCELCQRMARECLEWLPIYFRNLTRWRPGRAGARPVPGSREPKGVSVGADDRVSRALDEAGTDLVGWAEVLADDRPEIRWPLDLADLGEAEQAIRLCEFFAEHLTSIATLEWCGEFLRSAHVATEESQGVAYHERRLRVLTEKVVPGWYAGACRRQISMEAKCGADTFVAPGLTWVTCGRCGAMTHAADHLETILTEARDWVARPKDVAGALVALLDTEPSVPRLYDRIRKWESLGWVTGQRRLDSDGDPVGPKRYRLGDVLDLVLGHAEAPTRPVRMTSA